MTAIRTSGCGSARAASVFACRSPHANTPPVRPNSTPSTANLPNSGKSIESFAETSTENFSNPNALETQHAVNEAVTAGISADSAKLPTDSTSMANSVAAIGV